MKILIGISSQFWGSKKLLSGLFQSWFGIVKEVFGYCFSALEGLIVVVFLVRTVDNWPRILIFLVKYNVTPNKGIVLLDFPGKVLLFTFLGKIGWVSKIVVLIQCCFFFRLPENERVSEGWTFPGKKMLDKKKNTSKIRKTP